MNSVNGVASLPSSSSGNMQPVSGGGGAAGPGGTSGAGGGLKSSFKTPEGRYKLQYEKTYPFGFLHYSNGKTMSQASVAHLKDKSSSVQSTPTGAGTANGVRSVAARLWSMPNSRTISNLVGGSGSNKYTTGNGKVGSWCASSNLSSSLNFDRKGTYLIFNVSDTVFISDLESQDKDPIKSVQFNSNPICHAFDSEAKDGHDLLIGLISGDGMWLSELEPDLSAEFCSVSLRQQLQDPGKRIAGAHHYNKDGSINNSRCTCIAWVPGGGGTFVVGHADGNIYVYEKGKDGAADSGFPIVKDQTQFSVAHSRVSKSNPVARWHICQGSVNCIAFSNDGTHLATVGRDGYLRVFNYSSEQLVCGVKGYYGAVLCCAWSGDGKYILTGGEDDLVQVWSMEDRKVVARGEGHNSWVSAVAFDPYWSPPIPEESSDDSIMYRFGSVGQDARLLLWDIELNELVVPLKRNPSCGSPTFSNGGSPRSSSCWDETAPCYPPVGTLQPAPSMQDVPRLSPLVAQRVHTEPLSGLIFTKESLVTACREGHMKVWTRPTDSENPSTISIEEGSSSSSTIKEGLSFSPKKAATN